MADRIEQQFLIDAAAAIQTLNALDQSFVKFEQRLNSVAQSVTNFNNGVKNGAGAVTSYKNQVQAAANALGKATQGTKNLANSGSRLSGFNGHLGAIVNNLNEMYDRAKKFSLTVETLSRVALTQALVRSYNFVRDALADATRQAAEFQKQVALIGTIAGGVENGRIADSVKDITREFNIPVLEAAAGLYGALSNQVGDFGQTLEFTSEAAKFARATNSSLADSVDLLSAVLNSYGLTASDTNRVSSILFTTIDESRATASELGNSFGRVLPSATQLGVSLEEVSALLSSVSVQGLNSAESLTRVNALFTTLIKPSEALKEVYKDLGVASGELGVRQFGLIGFLDKVIEKGGESSAELAKLAPNIRGFGGIEGALSKGTEAFTKLVDKAKEAGRDGLIDKKYAQATKTNAEIINNALSDGRLKFLEYGNFIVNETARMIENFNSLGKSVPLLSVAFDLFTNTLATTGVTLATTAVGIFGVANAVKAFQFVFAGNPALQIAALAGAAAGLSVTLIQLRRDAEVAKNLIGFVDQQEENKNKLKEINKATAEDFERNFQAIKTTIASALGTGTKSFRDEYRTTIEGIVRQNTVLNDSAELAVGRIIEARRKYISELSKTASDATEQVESAQRRIANLQQGKSDRVFDASLSGLGDAAQVLKLTQRASELASKAAADLEKAAATGTQEQIDLALAQFDRAQKTTSAFV